MNANVADSLRVQVFVLAALNTFFFFGVVLYSKATMFDATNKTLYVTDEGTFVVSQDGTYFLQKTCFPSVRNGTFCVGQTASWVRANFSEQVSSAPPRRRVATRRDKNTKAQDKAKKARDEKNTKTQEKNDTGRHKQQRKWAGKTAPTSKTEEAKDEECKPEEAKDEECKPEEAKDEECKPEEAKDEECKPAEAKDEECDSEVEKAKVKARTPKKHVQTRPFKTKASPLSFDRKRLHGVSQVGCLVGANVEIKGSAHGVAPCVVDLTSTV